MQADPPSAEKQRQSNSGVGDSNVAHPFYIPSMSSANLLQDPDDLLVAESALLHHHFVPFTLRENPGFQW
jgi:hypothetical protein